MDTPWTSFRKRLGRSTADGRPGPAGASPGPAELPSSLERHEGAPAGRADAPLDAVGQRGELIRVRFANLVDRLDEIRSLKDDFTSLSQPVFEVIASYPQLQTRLLETEAVLRQERENAAALRREVAELGRSLAAASEELSAAVAQLRKADSKGREQEGQIEDLRLAARDRDAMVADLENQLLIETERARTITEENQALRVEAQEADQAVARAERELIEAREQNGLFDHEVKRLQKVAEEQNYRLSSLGNRHGELETQFEAVRQRASELESRLMAEQVARQRLESHVESERSAHQTDISAREMKIEGLASRLAATDKILAHTRDQLRDKNEALRGVERSLKELTIERNTLDRRLEAGQQEIDRHTALVNELQRSRVELQERVEMLNKAIAAKDFQIESAENKLAHLAERLDQQGRRFEQERSALESANGRLTEQLQNEKAERSLIQGALEIARESRVKIQRKYIALRKRTRLDGLEDDADGSPDEGETTDSNVRPLKAPDGD
jgi:crescentin